MPAVLDGARLLWPSRHVRWPGCPCTSRTWWHGVCVEVGADLLVYSETSGPEPAQGKAQTCEEQTCLGTCLLVRGPAQGKAQSKGVCVAEQDLPGALPRLLARG